MMERKKPIIIPEGVRRQFNTMVERAIENDISLAAKSPKHKAGSMVWVSEAEKWEGMVEIVEGQADVYLILTKDGEYMVCNDENIRTIN